MTRTTQRGTSNFPQLGGPGTQYHVINKAGEPKYTEAGNPETAWKFSDNPTFTNSAERVSATANLVHSIESASPENVKAGELWYPKVNEAVSKGVRKRGFMSGQADKGLAGAGIVAAVSPNMDWDKNNIGAFAELSSLKSHHWDTILNAHSDKQKGAARDIVAGMSISSAPLGNLQKAGRIIAGENPEDVLSYASAPKTHSFMHNIADPNNPPPGRYTAAGDIFKAVGGGMGISPSATQAISWSHVKYGLEQQGGARKQGPTRIGQPYFHPETGESAMHMTNLSGAQFLAR